jgi:hypothetical protein
VSSYSTKFLSIPSCWQFPTQYRYPPCQSPEATVYAPRGVKSLSCHILICGRSIGLSILSLTKSYTSLYMTISITQGHIIMSSKDICFVHVGLPAHVFPRVREFLPHSTGVYSSFALPGRDAHCGHCYVA